MKGLITILVIAFIGWCIICTRWYVCDIKGLCSSTDEEQGDIAGNLIFSKSSADPEINKLTFQLVDSLKNTPRDTLVIVGSYFEDEEGGGNLGLQRAKLVLSFLRSNQVSDPVRLESNAVSASIGDHKYRAIHFESIVNPKEEPKAFTLRREGSKITINFPVASADPTMSTKLADAIEELAQHIQSEDLELLVSGHTDNTGTHETNMYYGQVRADAIAQMLIEHGVSEDKITIVSKGELNPVATNETQEGKEKNRRVEIDLKTLK